jgi:hypothetical protein
MLIVPGTMAQSVHRETEVASADDIVVTGTAERQLLLDTPTGGRRPCRAVRQPDRDPREDGCLHRLGAGNADHAIIGAFKIVF